MATLTTHEGEAELPSGLQLTSLGVCRAGDDAPSDPFAAMETQVAVVRAGAVPLVLFDAELGESTLQALRHGAAAFFLVSRRPMY